MLSTYTLIIGCSLTTIVLVFPKSPLGRAGQIIEFILLAMTVISFSFVACGNPGIVLRELEYEYRDELSKGDIKLGMGGKLLPQKDNRLRKPSSVQQHVLPAPSSAPPPLENSLDLENGEGCSSSSSKYEVKNSLQLHGKQEFVLGGQAAEIIESTTTQPTSTVEQTQQPLNICIHCDSPRPYMAHHCYECNVCIHDLDHHCPWSGKCIGKRNILPFKLFLFNLVVLIFFTIIGVVSWVLTR